MSAAEQATDAQVPMDERITNIAPSRQERIVAAAGMRCTALGLAVIAGWHTGLTVLVQVRTQYRPMPYASAIGFGLSGLALVALARHRSGAARLLASAVVLITITSSGIAAGWIDFLSEHLPALPGTDFSRAWLTRMPPNAAVNFILAAAAVFIMTGRSPRSSAVALLGSIIGAIGLTTIFGYATNLTAAYAWRGLPPMAFHGALGFVLIGGVCIYVAWNQTATTDDPVPSWLPGPLGIASGTISLVVAQALLQDDRAMLASATLTTGVAVSLGLAISVHFALAARRELQRAEEASRELTGEIVERRRAEEALRDSDRRLRDADRRKDEFIAVLSHELRNPLAPIRYALPLLQRELISESARRPLAVISRQLAQMTRLVDDLLDVSRITHGNIELRKEHVPLGPILTAAVEATSPAFDAARHTLQIVEMDESIRLYVDPARLTQIITNVLDNSARYTPRGGRVLVRASRSDGEAVIRIVDDGIGIPEQALPTVFDMFRQVKRPDTAQSGLGIGLALARRLLEMHGGAIEAHSDGVGRGTEIVIRLPLAPEINPAAVPHTAAPASLARKLKVLVVDDNADLVEMLAALVSSLGHDVRKALDGHSAVLAALSYRPDVVLLDLGLPVISGIEVARRLRQAPETAHARIIALTGWGQTEVRLETKEAGFDYHLTKPTDPELLERLIGQLAAEVDPGAQ